MPIEQDNRIGRLYTSLGKDQLAILRFSGMDAINECFEYQVEAQAKDAVINIDDVMGTHMSVELLDAEGSEIYYDGIVVEAVWADEGDTGYVYRFTLRPWFWLMSKRINRRIHQEVNVQDILNTVIEEFPGPESCPVDWKASLPGPAEYTVQYGESDMHFIMRLLQRYGLNFHFEHDKGEHKMVVVDQIDDFPKVSGHGGERAYLDSSGDLNYDKEHFWDLTPGRRLTTGVLHTTDYNFKTPTAGMVATQTANTAYANAKIERYVYPGIHGDQNEGKDVAKRKLEGMTARDAYFTSTGNTLSLCSGMRVEVLCENHAYDFAPHNPLLCTKAVHNYVEPGYRSGSGGGGGDGQAFVGHYELAPGDVPYLPEDVAFETKMPGPQTAIVVGPGGEEIYTDEYGRIKVQFYWDRHGAQDETSTMFMRVAQLWAGAGWGALFIPRIGMEVIVDFLEGDMNQPVVIGCVYNADNMPPYELPGDKNWNGIKSNSTIGGGGYNEIVFNDTKGDELFRQHAQYDMETLVLHDERRIVNNDRTTTIGHDETRTVKNNEKHTIVKNSEYLVKGDRTRTIEGKHVHEVNSGEERSIKSGQTNNIKGGRETDVTGTDETKSSGKMTLESTQEIELKVGGSSIKLDNSGITVKGLKVEINGTGQLKTSGGGMAEHSAGGVMTVKGALVKIN